MRPISSRSARQELEGASIPTNELRNAPGAAGLGLHHADRDHDGQIEGRELDRLIADLDRLDGRRDGQIGRGRRGVQAQRALQTVAELTGEGIELAREIGENIDLSRGISFIGMTGSSLREAARLRERGVPVDVISDVPRADGKEQGQIGRTVYNLDSPVERRNFARSLGVPPEVAEGIYHVLTTTPHEGRAEIAALAQTWSAAYRDQAIPERLMLSGHGDGQSIVGAQVLNRDSITALARAMPEAAASIRHVHVAACQHGYESRMEPYFEAFPNLQSVWGYAGWAPAGATAMQHQALWERATQSDTDSREVHASLAEGTRRATAVSVQRAGEAWEGPNVEPMHDLELRLLGTKAQFEAMRDGLIPISRAALDEDYQTLQQLRHHHDFQDQGAAFREGYQNRLDQTLRLRFFDSHINGAFESHYGDRLNAGYEALGIQRPDFSQLDRQETMRAIATFNSADDAAAARGHRSHDAREARAILKALSELDPALIPLNWL